MKLKPEIYLQKITHNNYIVRDHRVYGIRTLPGVTLLDIVYRLAGIHLGTCAIELRQIVFKQPVVTSESFDQNVYVTFAPSESQWKVTVTSQKVKGDLLVDPVMDENMECLLLMTEDLEPYFKCDVNQFIQGSTRHWDMDEIYGLARNVDITHFEFMKTLGTVYQRGKEELMKLHLGQVAEKFRDKFYAHPAFLDGSTFAGSSFRLVETSNRMFHDHTPYIPFMIERFRIYQSLPNPIFTYSQKTELAPEDQAVPPDIFSTNITILNDSGEVLVEFEKFTAKRIRQPRLIQKFVADKASPAVQPLQATKNGEEKAGHLKINPDLPLQGDYQSTVVSYLQGEIAAILGKDLNQMDVITGFYDLGLDSTQLLNLVKIIEQKLNQQLYPTLLFEYSNIQRLSEYLLENHISAFVSCGSEPEKIISVDNELQSVAGDMNDNSWNENKAEVLLYETAWYPREISTAGNSDTPIRHLIVFFDDDFAIQAEIQREFPTAMIAALSADAPEMPSRIAEKFRQCLEVIQSQLRQKNTADLTVQVIADSDQDGRYVHTLSGLLKTAYLENPRICSQIIQMEQLNSQSPQILIQIMRDELRARGKGSFTIHYRGNPLSRYIQSLREMNFAPTGLKGHPGKNGSVYKENGVYVITGGSGGLGLLVAGHIAGRVKAKLALIGRSKLHKDQNEKIQRIIQTGSQVLYLQADIGNATEAVKAFSIIGEKLGPINGIFHCAGVIQDQFIIKKDLSEITKVFHPKVNGLWNIDEITKDRRLDFLVTFSSVAAVLGNIGQVDYAGANAWMDIFVLERREKVNQGKRYGQTITVNWPLWSEGGMRIDNELEQSMLLSSGMKVLLTEPGLQVLDALLEGNYPQSVVLYGDASKIRNYIRLYSVSEEKETKMGASVVDNKIREVPPTANDMDIAVVGLSGRYPMADTIEKFYQNLKEGKDCITGFPKERWRNYQFPFEIEEFYKYGGFVSEIDRFDALFFNISPRQAEMMDPQARLFLQAAWETCEDAGFYSDRTRRSFPSSSRRSVGVFAGVFWNHYELFAAESTERGMPMSLGITSASIPNMVSYCLNFHGPSMAVDSMCSSSLTAIHLACESIRNGECHFAIAGGVNLVTHPHKYMFLKQTQFLASDGKCRSFGEGGDGYVPGEGVGAVLLTTLANAQREGYPIYGVIKGSALNHVGKTSGVTVPDPVAQAEVIGDAIQRAGIDARTISYIEAHGTGTSLGDPIEIQGLKKAFSQWTQERQFCAVGSLKSNIGHLEAAAGIAGLTKLLLQFKHGEIFPSLHSEKLNPHIPFRDTPFYVEQQLTEWQRPILDNDGRKTVYPRRAGISSFGANGSNAHVIVEEYIPTVRRTETVTVEWTRPVIVPLSARDGESLKVYAQKLLVWLKKGSQPMQRNTQSNLFHRLRDELVRTVAEFTQIPKNDLEISSEFIEFNLDPVQIHKFCQLLEEQYGIEMVVDTVAQTQTIDGLAAILIKQHRKELENRMGISGGTSGGDSSFPTFNIADIAYTCQVGRESMESRAAFIVTDVNQFIQQLAGYIDGKVSSGECLCGEVRQAKDTVQLFDKDQDYQELINRWIRNGKIRKIAELWVNGFQVNWELLYPHGKPSRVSLPTYPFKTERYWVTGTDSSRLKEAIDIRSAVLHPLVHRNTSDFSEQRFSSRFSGQERFLTDHQVKGEKILPGVAYLEMARVTIQMALGDTIDDPLRNISCIHLRNIIWSRPMIVQDQPSSLHIRLRPEEKGEIFYEVYNLPETGSDPVVYSQGSAVVVEPSEIPIIDLQAVKSGCQKGIRTAGEVYQKFSSLGFTYGPEHQGINTLYIGEGQVLARLALSSPSAEICNEFVLHPGMMDAALQATIGLAGDTATLALPFALEELEIYGRCLPQMWAWVKYRSAGQSQDTLQKMDIDLADDTGRVLVRMKGYSARVLESEFGLVGENTTGTLMLKPVWREQKLGNIPSMTNYNKHFVILIEMETQYEDIETGLKNALPSSHCLSFHSKQQEIEQRFQEYAVHIFEEIQKILRDKNTDQVLLQIVIPNSQNLQFLSGLSGTIKTAKRENPKLNGQIIAVDDRESSSAIIAKIKENSYHPETEQIKYENGRRLIAGWAEINPTVGRAGIMHKTAVAAELWKDGGVYLITGGGGGLGLIFTKEIAQKVKNATVILMGRREPDEYRKSQIKELEASGIRVAYRAVDITRKKAVESLIQSIHKQFGTINGIIHSAGIIQDNYIIKKTTEEFINVLAPKVCGLVNLDQASKDLPLDFFIIFSSVAGAMGNPGQADYSVANAFMDGYVKYRNTLVALNQRHGRTVTLNWPLWKDGGMRITDETQQMMVLNTGLQALETPSGIQAFYRSLFSGQEQVMVLEGNLQRLRFEFLQNNRIEVERARAGETKAVTDSGIEPDLLRIKVVAFLKNIFATVIKLPAHRVETDAPFEKYGIDSIVAMQLTSQLETVFGSLPKTLFFEYTTLDSLTEYFLQSFRERLTAHLGIAEKVAAAIEPREAGQPQSIPFSVSANQLARSRFFHELPKPVKTSDIAIIAISGRYPGAGDIHEFWNKLRDGVDSIVEIPNERWEHSLYYDPDRNVPGKTYSKWGGFLDEFDRFDPLFFKISPREARMMDPQERLFLETVWNLFESGGYTRPMLQEKYRGKVGVYVGAMYQQYHLLGSGKEPALSSFYSLANRVSYFFNFNGPSIAIDTACSSATIAIHMACESLLKGDCELAIAGGVNLTIHPKKYLELSMAQMLGSHADSRSFGDGDGFLPAEAVGAVLLKPLSQAIRDRDQVLAVIKSTAVNHGGHSNGYTVPNLNTMVQLFEDDFNKSGIDPRTISYVEAAANGSALGDPIELEALVKAFRKFTSDQEFCAIGSVKSNIGHAEAASGITQLTKVVLQMQNRKLVPSIKAEPLNPKLSFTNTPFYLQRELRDWKRPVLKMNGVEKEFPRRATVSSFGAGGAFGHLIIEEYIPGDRVTHESMDIDKVLFPLIMVFSAKNRERLAMVVRQMLDFLDCNPELSLPNLAYTLQLGREEMESRLAMVVDSREQLIQGMKQYLDNQISAPTIGLFVGDSGDDEAMMKSLHSGKAGESLVHALLAEHDLHKLAFLWTQGGKIPWMALYQGALLQKLNLPTYPFEKRRYWVESESLPAPDTKSRPVQNQPPVHSVARTELPRNSSSGHIIEMVCDLLGISSTEMDIHKPLYQYGFDSILWITLYQRLQSRFRHSITLDELRDSKTTQDIINVFLAQSGEPPELSGQQSAVLHPQTAQPIPEPNKSVSKSLVDFPELFPELVHLNQISEGRPIFWFHAALGGVEVYYQFAQRITRPFYGIQARGWMNQRAPLSGIETMAAYYIDVIRSIQPEGPYDLGGYSLGGVIAYEVTRQLQELGQNVASIVMLDTIYTKTIIDNLMMDTEQINTEAHYAKDVAWKDAVLRIINMSLLSQNQEKAGSILAGLIHRDELDVKSDKETFLNQAVKLALEHGINKTESQLKKLILQNAKVQTSYQANDYKALPLPRPESLTCYYFRNKGRTFYGELEPYFQITPYDGILDNQPYWQEWQNQIKNFQIIDLDCTSHMQLLAELSATGAILSFCETLYNEDFNKKRKAHPPVNAIPESDAYKISILAPGSQGDVQPFVALGKELKKSDYEVTIAAIDEYRELVIQNGLFFKPLNFTADQLKKIFSDKHNQESRIPIALSGDVKNNIRKNIAIWLDNSFEACQGCDLLIYTGLAYHYGIHLVDKLKITAISVYLQPVTANSAVPSYQMPDLQFGSLYNLHSYRIAEELLWKSIGEPVNEWRKQNGLQPLSAKEVFAMKHQSTNPLFYGFPSLIFPKPSEWNDQVFLTGYFCLEPDREWKPSPKLVRFLEAGPAPVYAGFGSMNTYTDHQTTVKILEALKDSGERILLAVGWENIRAEELSENMFITGYAPHEWLFPRMKAIIHHGGAGTTGAALRAGVPSIIIPIMMDQPFWGNQAYKLGVCPKPIPYRNLTADKLRKALQSALNEEMSEKAEWVGRAIRNEDGVKNAVTRIHQLIAQSKIITPA